jgi:penicillin-binding protein 1C
MFISFNKKDLLKRVKKSVIILGISISSMITFFFILNYLFPIPSPPPYSTVIYDQKGVLLHAFLSKDEKWRFESKLKDIPDNIKKAFLNKEDKYFYYHPGVNIPALGRAFINNTFKWKKTSGASTISMQVVRLLEPRKRSYLSKVIEIFRAIQLEWKYSKDEIFELYLNLIPYGSNIEGIKAASLIYYQKSISQLSLGQIACLTIIPNRPTSLNPTKGESILTLERNKWLNRFKEENIFDSLAIQDALKEPNKAQRHSLPKNIPHLSFVLRKSYPDSTTIITTIEYSTQKRVELLVQNYMNRLYNLNIHNCAIYVLNNTTRTVEAYIGSNNFSDAIHQGQVNGIRAKRSPGSTLKPFIYGIAMDKGLLTPKYKIEDIPSNFDGYAPNNFDMEFHGPVTVEQSLAYSLNVPAVKTLDNIGVSTFTDFLIQAGFSNIRRNKNNLGLSLALGGCSVSLEELTHLYTIFSHHGMLLPYSILKNDTTWYQTPLLSESSAYMISEILKQITRPDLPHNVKSSFHIPAIAWKTGTSYGRKDAWSIGFNAKYTIGVWIGNFTGEGIHELTGADMATPLLFEIFNTLDYNSQAQWYFKPKNVQQRLVCPVSGLKKGNLCEESIMDYYIPAVSNPIECQHLKKYFVSADESFIYCSKCLPENGYKIKTYPNLSASLQNFYHQHHIPFKAPPTHNPRCTHTMENNPPKILSPVHRKEYLIEKNTVADIKLQAIVSSDVKKIYWYIDNKFYMEASLQDVIFYTPTEGWNKIQCIDDQGRMTQVDIKIIYY